MAVEQHDILGEYNDFTAIETAPSGAGESWQITDDSQADWALRRIHWHQQQIERREAFVEAEIERLQSYLEKARQEHGQSITFFESRLQAYFDRLRTEGALGKKKSYRLPHGTLSIRAAAPKLRRDDPVLLEWAKPLGLIREKVEPDWQEIKRRIAVNGFQAVDTETGEVVPGVIVAEPERETFSVKVEGGE